MREVMRWPWWFSFLVLGLDFSIVIALWAGLGNNAALIGLISTLGLSIFFYQFTSLTIERDGNVLRVGRAAIELQYLGEIEALDRQQMQHFLREGFKPRAFYAMRFWVKTGIMISIVDRRDPTPFWIVSSKRAAETAKLIKS
ncbi:MAG: DUF3093 domain-containing protein [Actinomycetota bacterium]